MQRYGKSAAHHFFQYRALLQFVVKDQDVVKSLGNFDFRGENKVGEEKLDAGPILEREVGGRDFHQSGGLPRAGVAGHVKRIFDPADDKKPEIVVGRRFVAHLEGQFHQHRLDGAAHGARHLARLGIADVALQKGERWQEPDVEIIAQFKVGDDAEVKTRTGHRLRAVKRVVLDEFFGMENPEIALVVAQGNPKIIVFILKVQVVDVAALVELGLEGRQGQTHAKQPQ